MTKKEGQVVYCLPKPNRHGNLIERIIPEGNYMGRGEQGFVCDDDSFLNRVDAGVLAVQTGQVRNLNWPPKLSSDDLW